MGREVDEGGVGSCGFGQAKAVPGERGFALVLSPKDRVGRPIGRFVPPAFRDLLCFEVALNDQDSVDQASRDGIQYSQWGCSSEVASIAHCFTIPPCLSALFI